MNQAKRARNLKVALDAIRTLGNVIREGRGNASLLGQLTGELQNASVQAQVFIVVPPPVTGSPNGRSVDEHVVNLALPIRGTP